MSRTAGGASEARVIDTSVLSLFLKEKEDTRAAAYLPHIGGREGIISFMTLAELLRWPVERRWGPARRQVMERYLRTFAIHYADERLCRVWAALAAQGRLAGRPLHLADVWIAATALVLGLTLVTHNPRDFIGIDGLTVISEAP